MSINHVNISETLQETRSSALLQEEQISSRLALLLMTAAKKNRRRANGRMFLISLTALSLVQHS